MAENMQTKILRELEQRLEQSDHDLVVNTSMASNVGFLMAVPAGTAIPVSEPFEFSFQPDTATFGGVGKSGWVYVQYAKPAEMDEKLELVVGRLLRGAS